MTTENEYTLINRDELQELVYDAFRDTPDAPPAKILERVEAMLEARVIRLITKIRSDQSTAKSNSARASRRVSKLSERLAHLPTYLSKKTSAIPVSRGAKFGFWLRITAGGAALIWEGANLSAFLLPRTDSWPLAILWSLPPLAVPLGEAAFLASVSTSERALRIIHRFQFVLMVASMMAYLYYTLLFGDTSVAALFSHTQKEPVSLAKLRMFFQVLTSLSFSGLCFSGALSMMRETPDENPAHEQCFENIEEREAEVAEHERNARDLEGKIQEIQISKKEIFHLAESIALQITDAKQNSGIAIPRILKQLNPPTK